MVIAEDSGCCRWSDVINQQYLPYSEWKTVASSMLMLPPSISLPDSKPPIVFMHIRGLHICIIWQIRALVGCVLVSNNAYACYWRHLWCLAASKLPLAMICAFHYSLITNSEIAAVYTTNYISWILKMFVWLEGGTVDMMRQQRRSVGELEWQIDGRDSAWLQLHVGQSAD